MNELNYSEAAEAWKNKFAFLAELTPVYLTIMALANCWEDIAKLHAVLPLNQRVLPKDLWNLETFWRCYQFQDKGTDQMVWRWLLERQTESHAQRGFGDYYLQYINDNYNGKGEKIIPDYEFRYCIESTKEENQTLEQLSSLSWSYFSTVLRNPQNLQELYPIEVECSLIDNEKTVIFRLVTSSDRLTEPFVLLLSCLPAYDLSHHSDRLAQKIYFSYALPAKGLIEKLEEGYAFKTHPRGHRYYISSQEFLTELTLRVKNLGLPLEEIAPVL